MSYLTHLLHSYYSSHPQPPIKPVSPPFQPQVWRGVVFMYVCMHSDEAGCMRMRIVYDVVCM